MPSYAWQILDGEFILINYNQSVHEITKGAIEKFVGIKASEFYKDQPEILRDLQRCLKERSNFFKEMKYKFKSTGEEKYLSVNYGFIPPDIIVVLANDITEKKNAETRSREMELELKKSEKKLKKLNYELEQKIEERTKELKKSEQRYRLIAENINDLIGILNEDYRYEYINETIHRNLRATSNEKLIGTTPLDIVHPDDVEINKESFRKTLEEGEGVVETRIRNLWGGYNWFEAKGKTFIDVDGKKKVLLIARDITERKENELLLKQSERKYRHLFENSPYRIVLINTDGKIIDYNSTTSNLMSNNKIEVIGKDFRELEFISQDNVQILKKMFTDLLIKGFTNPVEINFGKESNLGWANLHASIVQVDNQKIIQVLLEDINKRKKAEKRLKKSEENYRLISENANDIIVIVDKNAKIKYINKKPFKKNFGYAQDEIIDRQPSEFIHPDDLENGVFPIEKVIRRSKGLIETRIRHKKGHYIYVELSVSVFLDKDGGVNQLLFLRNITKRKQAELKLKETLQRYRLITENINDLIGIINDQFKFEYFNEKILKELSGFSSKERIEKSPLELIHPEDYDKTKKILSKVFKIGEGMEEFRFKNKNGDYIWLEVKGKTFTDIDGKKKLLMVSRDITERKKAEDRLKDSEEKYRNMINNLDVGFFKTDVNGIFLTHNPALSKILGFDPTRNLIGLSAQDYWEKAEDLQYFYQNLIKNNVTRNFIHKARKKNSEIMFLQVDSHLNKDLENNLIEIEGTVSDITEKYILEQKLKESEEIFRTITEQSLFGIAIMQDNLIKYVNNRLADLFGIPIEEAIGLQAKEFLNFIHPDDKLFVAEQTRKKQLGEKDVINQYQFRGLKKNGEIIWVEVFSTTINYQGKPANLVTIIDITENKKSELKLMESEEKYRTLIENIPQRIFLKDKNSVYISCNNNYAKDLKIKADEIIGKTDYDFYPKELADKYKADDKRIISTGEAEELDEFDILNSNKRYVRTIKTPIHDNSGNITGLIGIFLDITERKEAEEKLRESEKKYRELYEEAPNAYFSISPRGKIENCNKAAEKFLGYTNDEFLSMKVLDLYANTENGVVKAKKIFQQFLEGSEIKDEMLQMKDKSGKIIWVILTVKPLLDPNGNVIESRSMIIDIDRRKKAEEKLKKSEKKYREAFNRANFYKDLFVHDINNIMQVINSSAELISYQSDQIEQTIDIDMITNMIKKQVMRAKKLVQSVNTLSELENNEKPIQPTEVCELLNNTFNYINTAYQERNVNIQFEYFSKRIYAMANDILQEVFDNILINSVKYTSVDSPEIFVKISKEKRDKIKYVKIEFIDNGIGIADDRKDIIFKRGHRELKGQKGMGLGLSLVKKIVKSYNGKIWVEDRVKDDHTQGSNFILLIPQST